MASWVEYFKMPLREIEKKYTRSELALIAWRSQEVSASMLARQKGKTGTFVNDPVDELPPPIAAVMNKYKSELGDMDLRKMKGDQLRRHFAGMGLMLPVMASK